MNIIIVALLISFVFIEHCSANYCHEPEELQTKCGGFCHKAIKPALDHARNLESQVNDLEHQPECLALLEKSEKVIEAKLNLQESKIQQQFEELRRSINKMLEKLVEVQGRQLEPKLNEIQRKLAEASKSKVLAPYKKIGSKYYYIEEHAQVDWFEARQICEKMDGHLVSIKNLDEMNAIKAELRPERHYWLDFNDIDKEGEFVSIVTGKRPTYFNWHKGNPDDFLWYNEDCGELYYFEGQHLMNDSRCNYKEYFICEPKNQS